MSQVGRLAGLPRQPSLPSEIRLTSFQPAAIAKVAFRLFRDLQDSHTLASRVKICRFMRLCAASATAGSTRNRRTLPCRALKKPSAREPARAIGSKVGSFSAVSTPLIARVGAFFSIFRDLQDYHTFAPLRPQNFSKISTKNNKFLANFLQIFLKFLQISVKISHFSRRF